MKKLICSWLLALVAIAALAVPANPEPFVYTQPNGQTIVLRLVGDEYAHALLTEDGREAIIGDDGMVTVTRNSHEQVTRRLLRQRADRLHQRAGRLHQRARQYAADAAQPASPRDFTPSPLPQRALIILVSFADVAFTNTQEAVFQLMNNPGYSYNGATGSARDYFEAQSMGTYRPQFDVVGPVTLSHATSYYGANLSNGDDRNPYEMFFEATRLVAEQGLVNLADYDQDDNGLLDMVYIIFAGRGEADGGRADTVWPFMDDIQTVPEYAGQEIQDRRLSLIACSAEQRGNGTYSGIGTFCHEFGHCLGLPDIYDVDYSGGYGMGRYDIMSSGSYLNNGNTPPAYSGFERYCLGWLDFTDVDATRHVDLEAIDTGNQALRLTTGNPNEYFILENRQQQGWDTYLPARGLLITHIDYDEQAWWDNTVNDDPDHQRVMLMAADNVWSASTATGDLYPGLLGNTAFTDDTTPSSRLWDGTPLGKPVTGITMTGNKVGFSVTVETTAVDHIGFRTYTTPGSGASATAPQVVYRLSPHLVISRQGSQVWKSVQR